MVGSHLRVCVCFLFLICSSGCHWLFGGNAPLSLEICEAYSLLRKCPSKLILDNRGHYGAFWSVMLESTQILLVIYLNNS